MLTFVPATKQAVAQTGLAPLELHQLPTLQQVLQLPQVQGSVVEAHAPEQQMCKEPQLEPSARGVQPTTLLEELQYWQGFAPLPTPLATKALLIQQPV